MTALYQTRSHLDFNGKASPSSSADEFLSPLPVLSQQTSPLSMMPLMDHFVPSASSHSLEKMYDTSSHMGGSGQLEALFDPTDGFWPYDSPALQENDLSLLWSGDQAYQQQEQLTPIDPTAMLFPALPIASDSMPVPADIRHRAFPVAQLPQPSPEPITTPSMIEHQAFDFIGHMYGSPNDAQAINQFPNFHFPQPNVGATSLDSLPNIVQDENGLLHLEGQTDARSYL